jgi:hypothetical protein
MPLTYFNFQRSYATGQLAGALKTIPVLPDNVRLECAVTVHPPAAVAWQELHDTGGENRTLTKRLRGAEMEGLPE